MSHIIIGTAGHIDHGKTALVKLLTGTDADRLKEEKERGITIDLGFASLDLDDTTQIGFVDVPGHERFIKNMLAGIGGIDVVMLVVAADESIMPQTREHMEICSLLRIPRGLTVLTKIDAVDPDIADLVELEVREYLKSTFLEQAPIVRVSARTGEGRDELIETLRRVVSGVAPRNRSGIFRLPVDRCFTMKGFGTVVTGTIISGAVQKDQDVEMLPSGRIARVRGLQVHSKAVTVAEAGQRTAINLQGVDVSQIGRGVVLTEPGVLQAASNFDCHLELLRSAPGPINRRKRVRFHLGTAEIMGYLSLLEEPRMSPGEAGFVQVRLEEATSGVPGDRFIIRQYSPMLTIGGGEILEAVTRKHRLRDRRIIERLGVFRGGILEDRIRILMEESGLNALTIDGLVRRTGRAPGAVREALEALQALGDVRPLSATPPAFVAAAAFECAASEVLEHVLEFHRREPLSQGVSLEELRKRIFTRSSGSAAQSVLEELEKRKKIAAAEGIVRAFGRKVTLDDSEAELRKRMTAEFRGKGFQVRSPNEVIGQFAGDSGTARKILHLMLADGSLVKISEDLIVERDVIEGVIRDLRARRELNPDLGVGEFKDLVGVSRKYAIPLLEYLDREHVTRRVGNIRKIL